MSEHGQSAASRRALSTCKAVTRLNDSEAGDAWTLTQVFADLMSPPWSKSKPVKRIDLSENGWLTLTM
jgi:hypothetical protein